MEEVTESIDGKKEESNNHLKVPKENGKKLATPVQEMSEEIESSYDKMSSSEQASYSEKGLNNGTNKTDDKNKKGGNINRKNQGGKS